MLFKSSSFKMMLGTLLSRLTGQIRTIFLIASIGAVGQMADSFDLANNVPTSLNLIVTGGIFNALLVPQLVKLKKLNGGKAASDVLLSFSLFAVFILTLLLTIVTPFIITLISNPNWSTNQRNAAIFLGFLCMPQIFFYGVYVIFGQILASRDRFGVYSMAPILNNIVSIIVFATFLFLTTGTSVRDDCSGTNPCSIFSNQPMLILLGGGATLGIATQALILLIPIIKGKMFHFRLSLKVEHLDKGTVKQLGSLAKWSFLMILIEQFAALFYVHVASGAPAEALAQGLSEVAVPGNAAYTSALIIYIIPHSLLTMSFSATMFTKLSNFVHSGDLVKERETYLNSVTKVIILITPFVVCLNVLNVPIAKALIPSVSEAAINSIGSTIASLSSVLIFAGVFQMTTRLFFAHELQKKLFLIELPEYLFIVVMVKIVTIVSEPTIWVQAIGYCRATGGFFAMLFIIRYASRKILKDPRIFWKLLNQLLFALFSGIICAIVGNIVNNVIFAWIFPSITSENQLSWGESVLMCSITGIAVFAVYLLIIQVSGNIKKLRL